MFDTASGRLVSFAWASWIKVLSQSPGGGIGVFAARIPPGTTVSFKAVVDLPTGTQPGAVRLATSGILLPPTP